MPSEKLISNLQRIINELPSAVDRALTEAAQAGAQLARTETYYIPRGSSGLREATQAQDHGFLHKGIIADKRYASWVNFGNAPSGTLIYPIYAKNLRFVINGEVFYRKYVKASQPKPFWDNMLAWERHNLTKIISSHVERVFNG